MNKGRRPTHRTLHIITLSEMGGAQRVCCQTVTGLRRAGYDVGVACQPGGWLQEYLTTQGIRVLPLPHMKREVDPWADARTVRQLVRIIRGSAYDLVHCHSTKAGLLGRVAARLCGVPSVFTAHGWAFSEGTGGKRRALAVATERLVAPGTARIICVSEYDYRLALRHHVANNDKMVVIHNGIEDVFPGLLAAPAEGGSRRVTMVARFAAPKDYHSLISAAAVLKGDFQLWLVGDGPLLGELQGLVKQLGLVDRVRFWGAREDVAEILSRTHIGVLASNWEGLPISILEAMRAGLPIVATHVGGIPELVREGQNGYLVPRQNSEALAAVLQRLISDSALRGEMGKRSREIFLDEFQVAKMLSRTLGVYAEILGTRGV